MLDLPAPRHLLHDQLGIHPHLEFGIRIDRQRPADTLDQAAILCDVVCGDADVPANLGDNLSRCSVDNDRAASGLPRIAPRPAVRLDYEQAAH